MANPQGLPWGYREPEQTRVEDNPRHPCRWRGALRANTSKFWTETKLSVALAYGKNGSRYQRVARKGLLHARGDEGAKEPNGVFSSMRAGTSMSARAGTRVSDLTSRA